MGALLAGYFTERKADGVHDDLYAKMLFVENGSEKLIIAACDLVGVPTEFSYSLRKMISDGTGVPVNSVMVCATHTHTGPMMSGETADENYINEIKTRIAEEAKLLPGKAEPGTIKYGSDSLGGYAFNRRYFMKNGAVLTNPGIDNPDVVRPAAPVDDSVNVLKFSDASGAVKAVLANTGLHPDTVGGCKVSADWPGYLSIKVKEELGSDVDVLVLNGTQGDINHFDVMGKRLEQGIEEAMRIGSAYGGKVVELCGRSEPISGSELGGEFEIAIIPRRKIGAGELEEARKIVEEYGEEHDISKSGRTLESQDIARGDITVKVFFAKNMIKFHEKYEGTSANLEIAAMRFGDAALVGIGGELFTEIGLAIKKGSPFPKTMVAALANGYNGYLPTSRAFGEGGYETMPRDTSQFGEEAEGVTRETSLKLLNRLR